MFARTGINTAKASTRTSLALTGSMSPRHVMTSPASETVYTSATARTSIVRRAFSTSKPTRQATQQTPPNPADRVPRPIPMDIGNSPSASFFQSSSSSSAAASSSSEASSTASRRFRSYASGGSAFDKYGGPVLNIIIYSTAATLLLHVAYHQLALEEYKISSNQRLKDLEDEIATLKAQRVQHSLGGRGEFV